MNSRRLWVSLAVGTAISGTALYLAFRHVPLADLVVYLGSIDLFWVMVSVVLVVISFVLRALRWRIIVATIKPLPFWETFHPLMIGFMMNCILPGRVGEIARPAIVKKSSGIPFATGLATVATERMMDALVLILLFAWMISSVPIETSMQMEFGDISLNRDTLVSLASGTTKLCGVLVAGIVLISLESFRRWVYAILIRIPRVFGNRGAREILEHRIVPGLIRIIDHVAGGFQMIRSVGKLSGCGLLSLAIWALGCLSYYTMSLGAPGIELGILEMSVVMIVICFFIAIPSVPGFWGIWEAGGVFALSLFGIPASDAAGFTLVNHAVQMFPVIVVGLVSMMITGVNIFQLNREVRDAVGH